MSNLFLFTFVMLIITFFIGFFVALIIKIIASWADLLDFCQLHREELAEIKRAKKLHHQTVPRCGSIREREVGCREKSTYGSSFARGCFQCEIR